MITATNKATGEVVELQADTLDSIVSAWRIAQEYEKTAKALKDQLKKAVQQHISDTGKSDESSGYRFTAVTVQRKNYDKSKLFELIDDEDLRYEMLQPNKRYIDDYLKSNVDELGELSTALRNTMIDEGMPYEVIRLEKLTREME